MQYTCVRIYTCVHIYIEDIVVRICVFVCVSRLEMCVQVKMSRNMCRNVDEYLIEDIVVRVCVDLYVCIHTMNCITRYR